MQSDLPANNLPDPTEAADPAQVADAPEGAAPGKPLPAPALRALEEAAERRKADAAARDPSELGGPKGPEPTRYGDWERKGIAVDF
jgi:hypothetical protein